MGSQIIQGQFWGRRAKDWATIQEQTGNAGYEYALQHLQLSGATKLLDVGCGSGLFSSMAIAAGADVTGIDASEPLIEQAKERAPSATFLSGEMEDLPFADNAFDVVCGFNSFQYAADSSNAFLQARRVLKESGKLVTMIWGNKEDCEAASYLKAVGSLLPPSPPGAGGPFALSENRLLERIMEDAGFKIIRQDDVDAVWDYLDADTAIKGLISAGPVAKAIEHAGFDAVIDAITHAIQPYVQANGHVVYHNKFRVVIAE
ncbi:class I SAM-dependent methyltransferase [Mucilaginibacter glaciei]|uniref:Class I SAM-dependent methyltransferase n=1 Tax=Mucilaginibacter glaciei TaxID=2772109 RepID=A0A926S3G7_9SPHI|nr:class I SAM-dependent methyltransferase [Mucilaginibacter glaciei]MBD1394224.1 class I SAM-dependent methyltransferase [Mucilaginibacter glaciei]